MSRSCFVKIDKKPFGHCWIEKGGSILDFLMARKLPTKKKYYELGGIPVSGYKNYLYTPAEAAKKMVETGHWGLIQKHREF